VTDDAVAGPPLRIVRGDPSPEEIAALVVALRVVATAAAVAPSAGSTAYTRGGWNDLESLFPPALHDGRGVWRASGRLRGVRTRAAW
jgi:hypothetical protein